MIRILKTKTAFKIFITAFFIRLLVIAFLPQSAPDTDAYHSIAVNLVEKMFFSIDGVTPTGRFAPLYPLFLAANCALFGSNFMAVRLIQVVIDSFTCILIYRIGLAVFQSNRIGTISGLIASFHPSLIGSTAFILSETLYTFLLTASVLFLVRAVKSTRNRGYCLAGLLLGIATLCRPTSMLFPLFLVAGTVFPQKCRIRMAGLLILALTMAAVIAPWTVRNFLAFNEFLPIAVGGGGNLWVGSYIPWDGDYRYQDLSDKQKIEAGYSLIEADNRLREEGVKNIKNNPLGYLKLCIKKFGRFWFKIPGSKEILKDRAVIRKLFYVTHFLLLMVFVIGLKRAVLELNPGILVLLLMISYFTIVHVILFAIPRYRIPIIPLVIIFAGAGIFANLSPQERRPKFSENLRNSYGRITPDI